MYDNQLDYRAIQKRADAAIRQQQRRTRRGLFIVNFLLYMVFMAVTWGLSLTREFNYSGFTIAAMSVLSAGWTVALFLHGASLWMNSERGSQRRREQAIAREIQAEMRRLNMDGDEWVFEDQKAKRRERLVDDDAELVDFPVRDKAFEEDTR